MSKIYTGIDLGSHSIKMIVADKVNDEFHVLAATSTPSSGIKKGYITETKEAVNSLKKTIAKMEEMLGLPLKKAVVCVPSENLEVTIVTGKVKAINPKEITGEDVRAVLKDALQGKISEERELITAIPIHFRLDEEIKKDPKGLPGETLEVKAVITTIPKEPLYRLLEVVKLSGIEALDIAFHTTGDYFEIKNEETEKSVGAIINIGEETTNISVYNKGIMIKNSIINIGSHYVDKDISYVYHVTDEVARKIKEEFAVASKSYADRNDTDEVEEENGNKKILNQDEVSEVVESRIEEILKLAKKELNNLTNREISYIIITGGLSELTGFQYVVEDILGRTARICNIKTVGVRHNKYSSVLGLLKYYDDKLNLRGRANSMFTTEEMNLLLANQKQEIAQDPISKVFGHFFDN